MKSSEDIRTAKSKVRGLLDYYGCKKITGEFLGIVFPIFDQAEKAVDAVDHLGNVLKPLKAAQGIVSVYLEPDNKTTKLLTPVQFENSVIGALDKQVDGKIIDGPEISTYYEEHKGD